MQIVLFLIFILLVLLVLVSKRNNFSNNSKISITVVAVILAIGIYAYESSLDSSAEYNRDMVNAFKQGKTLTCGEHKVDNERFIYVSGTQTFMPKSSEEALYGVIVRVSTCKVD